MSREPLCLYAELNGVSARRIDDGNVKITACDFFIRHNDDNVSLSHLQQRRNYYVRSTFLPKSLPETNIKLEEACDHIGDALGKVARRGKGRDYCHWAHLPQVARRPGSKFGRFPDQATTSIVKVDLSDAGLESRI
jgi:hypothetical protein